MRLIIPAIPAHTLMQFETGIDIASFISVIVELLHISSVVRMDADIHICSKNMQYFYFE